MTVNFDDSRSKSDPPRLHLSHNAIAAPPPQIASDDQDELSLASIFAQVWARKWLVACVLCLGIIGGGMFGQLSPNEYAATSLVQVETRSSGVALPSELIGTILSGEVEDNSLNTEFVIIRSRLILAPVAEALNLDLRVLPDRVPVIGDWLLRQNLPVLQNLVPDNYGRAGDRLDLAEFIVADDQIGERFVLEITGPDQITFTAPDGASVSGRVGETLSLEERAEIQVAALGAPVGRKFTVFREPIRVTATRIGRNLTVDTVNKSDAIRFVYTDSNASVAQDVVNAVVETYREQNLNRRSAEIDQSIAFIEEQLPSVVTELEEALAELAVFQREEQPEELSLGTQALLQQVIALEGTLRDMEFREQLMLERLTEDHPDVRSLRSGKQQIQARITEARARLGDVPETERSLLQLKGRVDRATELRVQLDSRIEQLRVLRASTVANIRILENAEDALLVGPDRLRPVLLSGVLALLASVAIVLITNMLRRGIDDARLVEKMGLSVFATVGKVKELPGKRAGMDAYALALSDPKHLTVEAIRGIRTSLQFSMSASGTNSLMITSCAPSDGKSFLSLNLALVTAMTGARVLLIDADMRRGELRKHFQLSRDQLGLSDFLAGQADFGQTLYRDEQTSLEFIPTGQYPPNPSELLSTGRFGDLVDKLRPHYDLIIIDAPPVLAVSDAIVIGQNAGLTLLVVRHLATAEIDVKAAINALRTGGVFPSGIIMNQFDQSKSRYGNYGSTYGYYGSTYKYEYEQKK